MGWLVPTLAKRAEPESRGEVNSRPFPARGVREPESRAGQRTCPSRLFSFLRPGGNAVSAVGDLLTCLPADLRPSAALEAAERRFSPQQTRWLAALLLDDPLTPAPAAAAMVERVAGRPLGRTLLRLEETLDALPPPAEELLPGERRVMRVLLGALRRRVDELLTRLTP